MNKTPMYEEAGRAAVAMRRGRRGIEVKRRRKIVDTPLLMTLVPCPDWPEKRVREAVPKRVSLTDFLQNKAIPAADRVWAALHSVFLTDLIMRLFAFTCAERALIIAGKRGHEPDPSLWKAITVARWYAVGEATSKELADARDAAGATEWKWTDTARHASHAALWTTAPEAEWAAIRASEWATWAPQNAGKDAVRNAEREWQCARLVEMLMREEA